jgi:hypothetical protein
VASFPQVFLPKLCINLSSVPYVLHALSITFFSIWWPERYLASSTALILITIQGKILNWNRPSQKLFPTYGLSSIKEHV